MPVRIATRGGRAAPPFADGMARSRGANAAVDTVGRMSAERRYVADHRAELHADLDAWLRIPSVGADPARAADVLRSAQWLADAFGRTGLPVTEIWPAPGGAPAV